MSANPVTWAVLVPAPASQLQPVVRDAWVERFGEDEDDVAPWIVRQGSGAYSSIVSTEPGSEGDDEDLAIALSRRYPGTVYVLRFREGAEAVWLYAGGAEAGTDSRSPYGVAEALGVPVDEPPALQPAGRSFCVVEGAAVADVRRAVQESIGDSPVKYLQTPSSVIVYADRGSTGMLCPDIAAALPDATVYAVMTGPDRFGVLVTKGEDDIGSFEATRAPMPDCPPLAEIKGETEPRRIAERLGIPTDWI